MRNLVIDRICEYFEDPTYTPLPKSAYTAGWDIFIKHKTRYMIITEYDGKGGKTKRQEENGQYSNDVGWLTPQGIGIIWGDKDALRQAIKDMDDSLLLDFLESFQDDDLWGCD